MRKQYTSYSHYLGVDGLADHLAFWREDHVTATNINVEMSGPNEIGIFTMTIMYDEPEREYSEEVIVETVGNIIMEAEKYLALVDQVENTYEGKRPIPPSVFLYEWELEYEHQIDLASEEEDVVEKENTLRHAADILNICRRLRALGVETEPIDGEAR
jgi:hypothetical protein